MTSEQIFLPGVKDPIRLPPHSPILFLLQRIRDEAHRFAITYHRKLREKKAVRSELDDIPGIGESRKKALLRHFGSLEKIKQATVEEMAEVKGMSKKAAEEVGSFFRSKSLA